VKGAVAPPPVHELAPLAQPPRVLESADPRPEPFHSPYVLSFEIFGLLRLSKSEDLGSALHERWLWAMNTSAGKCYAEEASLIANPAAGASMVND
jgi:hypothetical protein